MNEALAADTTDEAQLLMLKTCTGGKTHLHYAAEVVLVARHTIDIAGPVYVPVTPVEKKMCTYQGAYT